MNFILTPGPDRGVADLSQRLNSELQAGKQVLWITCGGSNIHTAVQVMDSISNELTPNLTIMLSDERYGEVGHADSNWEQLMQAGFNPWQAKLIETLKDGADLDATVHDYNLATQEALTNNQIVIAQLGIGPDGHTAGILPHSGAASEGISLVAGYVSQPFTRITMTFNALRKVSAAYVFAFGGTKNQALRSLHDLQLPLSDQPAQILKELPEAYIYNDQVGDQ
jgi:6-phosphogluconolactonase/glucosamine-6-phosphate isomerase/deaminase